MEQLLKKLRDEPRTECLRLDVYRDRVEGQLDGREGEKTWRHEVSGPSPLDVLRQLAGLVF